MRQVSQHGPIAALSRRLDTLLPALGFGPVEWTYDSHLRVAWAAPPAAVAATLKRLSDQAGRHSATTPDSPTQFLRVRELPIPTALARHCHSAATFAVDL